MVRLVNRKDKRRREETLEEKRDREKRELDFAGEFDEVRKTNMTVDGDKLISGSKSKNPLNRIKLFNKIDDDPVDDADHRPSSGNSGVEEAVELSDYERERSKKKHKINSKHAESKESNTENKPKSQYHLDLDGMNEIEEARVKSTKSKSSFPQLLKFNGISSDEEDEDVGNDSISEAHLFTFKGKDFVFNGKGKESRAIYHLDTQDSQSQSGTSFFDQDEITQKEEITDAHNNKLHETNDDNDNDHRHMSNKNETVTNAQLNDLKLKLYSKLTGRSTVVPYGLESKFNDIYSLLEATVKDRESQSALVIGPKNSGKTACLNVALEKLRSEMAGTENDFLLVKISGITQENDKIAVKSIARQLDSEIARAYKINILKLDDSELLAQKSVTEAFANILSILDKHILSENTDQQIIRIPIVFVIDEVDVYANPIRQTLLYNLFDLVENSSTPITTLCFSNKFTIKDMLEKRVRSRFSQRTIEFPKFQIGQFVSIAEKIMSIDEPSNDYETKWNQDISKLVADDSNLRRLIIYNHLTVNNFKEFHNHCTYPLSKLSITQPYLNDDDFKIYSSNHKRASLQKIVNGLSELELSLLICAARLVVKNDLNWINLNTAYEEYHSQAKAQNKIRQKNVFNVNAEGISTRIKIWSKERCKEPWTVLLNLGLLTPPTSSSKNGGRAVDFSNNTKETKMWQLEITLDELRFIVESDKNVKSWTRL